MRRSVVSLLLLALIGLLATGFAGCGEEDAQLLPGGTAREITANLETVEQLADEGDCAGAESAALQVSEQVEALRDVDDRLQRALEEGADRLTEVVAGCEEEAEATEPAFTEPEAEAVPPDEEEKEREKQEREEEKEQREEEREEEREEAEPSLPPQAEGEGKGLEKGDQGDSDDDDEGEGESGPSGGVGPATPAGEG